MHELARFSKHPPRPAWLLHLSDEETGSVREVTHPRTCVLSDHAGISTQVFQVSYVPHCCGLSCAGLVLPGPWGLETGQEMSKVKKRKAEDHGSSGTHLLTCLELSYLQGLGQVGQGHPCSSSSGAPPWATRGSQYVLGASSHLP